MQANAISEVLIPQCVDVAAPGYAPPQGRLAAKRPYIMCRRLYEVVRAVRIAARGRVG
jgi:hypothetical protein